MRSIVRRTLRPVRRWVREHVLELSRRHLLEAPLDAIRPVEPLVPVTFRFGGRGDLDRLTDERHGYKERSRRYGRERLRRGDRLLIGERDGDVVFYNWFMSGEMEAFDDLWPLAPDAVFSYKSFTVEAERGRRIRPAGLAFAARAFASEGGAVRRILSLVASWNEPSLRAMARVGLRRRGSLLRLWTPLGAVILATPGARAALGTPAPRRAASAPQVTSNV